MLLLVRVLGTRFQFDVEPLLQVPVAVPALLLQTYHLHYGGDAVRLPGQLVAPQGQGTQEGRRAQVQQGGRHAAILLLHLFVIIRIILSRPDLP